MTDVETIDAEIAKPWLMTFGPEQALPNAPRHLQVEITTRCNLTCVMCPHGLPGGMTMKRDAPDPIVDSVLELIDDVDELCPTGIGEPMMAPRFWDIVDRLAGRSSPGLTFHTNGILLTQKNVDRLTRAPIKRVNVSVDAATEPTYRQVRGSEIERTLDGIRRLVAATATVPKPVHPQIIMSMVLMRQTVAEAPAFVELAHGLGVNRVYFEHLVDPLIPATEWTVHRGDFRFNYAEQNLLGSPQDSDPHILAAMDVADHLDVVIDGVRVLLAPELAAHDNRPCRTGWFLPKGDGAR
ncbi:MAG: radical SAM protein [Actinomycetota bacterium]